MTQPDKPAAAYLTLMQLAPGKPRWEWSACFLDADYLDSLPDGALDGLQIMEMRERWPARWLRLKTKGNEHDPTR